MSEVEIWGHSKTRRLVNRDGSEPAILPPAILGDTWVTRLRLLKELDNGTLAEWFPNVRGIRASIGQTFEPPGSGTFTLTADGGSTESDALRPWATAAQVYDALEELDGITVLEVAVGGAPATWLVRFDESGPQDVEVGTNALEPSAFVRVRAFTEQGVWWHEIRLLVAPPVYTSTWDRVLTPAPSITRVRLGAPRVEGSSTNTNEVQALRVPREFRGQFYVKFDYRASGILSVASGVEDIAAALNAMWTDGKTRFAVTTPQREIAHVEFVGPLEAAPQDLLEVVVYQADVGDLTLTLDLENADLAEMLRDLPEALLPIEFEITHVGDYEDPEDDEIPDRVLTIQGEVTVKREHLYAELAQVPAVNWLRPPQPRRYVAFDPSMVITGNQHHLSVIGDNVANAIAIAHGLNTAAIHVTVRENSTPGAILQPDAYTIEILGEDEIEIAFPVAPATDEFAVLITSAGPASAFAAHGHNISDVEALQDELDALGLRLTAIEDLLPSIRPAEREDDGEPTLALDIAPAAEVFPLRDPYPGDASALLAPGASFAALPRLSALLPAIHDATANNISNVAADLGDPESYAGMLFENLDDEDLLVPGGYGRRSETVPPDGFFGSDGRTWYALSRAEESNSYFPAHLERELFLLHVSPQMFQPGATFEVTFDLTLATILATSRMSCLLVIEVGTVTETDEPDPTDTNIEEIEWEATPVLEQRLIIGRVPVKHRFGASVDREANGDIGSADSMAYGVWTGDAQAPASADFVIRARLVQFDTENNVSGARGFIAYAMANAQAGIT